MHQIDRAVDSPALPSLTGLRWIAAFLVFGYHLGNLEFFQGRAQSLLHLVFGGGGSGVSLFFVLSGFVLVWSASEHISPTGFWRRRFARVYPLHAVGVVLALILAATIVPSIASPGGWSVVANLALVSSWVPAWGQAGNPVSWTLACEAFFYFAFPLVIIPLRRASARILVVVSIAMPLLTLAFTYAAPSIPGVSDITTPLARLPEFVLGMSLALLIRRGLWRGPGIIFALVVFLLGYAAVLTFPASPLAHTWMTLPGYALVVPALARIDIERRRSILATRPLVYLGVLSYAFYLVHLLTMQAIASFWPGPPRLAAVPALGMAAVVFGIALALAWVLHLVVEQPARRLIMRRWRPAARSTAESSAAG